jgi:hypothetical protein
MLDYKTGWSVYLSGPRAETVVLRRTWNDMQTEGDGVMHAEGYMRSLSFPFDLFLVSMLAVTHPNLLLAIEVPLRL